MTFNTPSPEIVAELQSQMDSATANRNTGPAPEGYVKCTEIAKALNGFLKDAGSTHVMKPQMVYTYAKKGIGGLETDNYPFVPVAAAQEFINRHFARLTLGLEDEAVDNEDEEVDPEDVEVDDNDETTEADEFIENTEAKA